MFGKTGAITNFIFDWSGVISNDLIPIFVADNYFRLQKGLMEVTIEEFVTQIHVSGAAYLRDIGFEGTDEALTLMAAEKIAELKTEGIRPVIFPYAANTLAYFSAQGFNLGLLSSHPEDHLLEEAKEYGVTRYFQAIKGSSHNKASDIVTMMETNNWAPQATAYFGDQWQDIVAAKKAQVTAVAVCSGYSSRSRLNQESPDTILAHIGDLKTLYQNSLQATI